jgi:hypothetical protein
MVHCSVRMPNKTPRQYIYWIVYAGVVFFVTTEGKDLLTTWIHPYNVQLLNATGHNIAISSVTTQSWGYLDLFTLIITLVIVGLTATWYVNREKERVTEAKNKLEEKQREYERDTRVIYDDMHKKFMI